MADEYVSTLSITELVIAVHNDEKIKKDILAILKFQLDDNAKQRRLLPSGNYTRPRSCMDSRSQKLIYDYFS